MRGVNFDLLPNELVLLYDSADIDSTSNTRQLHEVERGSDYVVFSPLVSFTASVEHVWQFLASPFSPPRSFIEYTAI